MAKSKRELIEPTPGDKRYVRRAAVGTFESEGDLNQSLSQDDRHNSKKTSKPGQGNKADGYTDDRQPPQ